MKGLSNIYEKPSISNKIYLMSCLFNLKMNEGAFVIDHSTKFNLITSQLSYVKINFENEVLALIILSSFSKSWGAIVIVVSSSCGLNKLKFEEV